MDSSIKRHALSQAIEMTKVALSTADGSQNYCAANHPEVACKFLEEVYRKLCELHEDSLKSD